jgi:hypothetical protein
MADTTLTLRQLNRATLARQLLLQREKTTPVRAIERLAGLQAQLARPPYLSLWSRVEGFSRASLSRAAARREVVRATLMRATLHLFSAADFHRLRPSLQPALDRVMKSTLRDRVTARELPSLVAEARAFFAAEPRTFDELRDHLAARWPDGDVRAMGYAVRCTLPLVQVPGDGAWGWPGVADFAPADEWLGKRSAADGDPATLVLRYLAAFGPASPADVQIWSGLPSPEVKATFEVLRPKLRRFRDERGRELYDLPRAPRPDEETPAPVRFLPEYDNLVLGHDDRRRLIADAHRAAIFRNNLQILPTFFVDGWVAGTWKIARAKRRALLTLSPFAKLPRPARDALTVEGEALLGFAEPEAEAREVRFGV